MIDLHNFLFFVKWQGAKGAEVAKLFLIVGFAVFTPFLHFHFCV